MLLLRAKTSRKIRTTLVTDANVQVERQSEKIGVTRLEPQATLGFETLGP